eukprot:CAMPEP_0168598518 /NCGR_PEP_ID=MMETSP0420-20121227/11453_1 /TAXON_ID=498008 /ORGANISM="Pessonella sp." /LENGTH=834 /DNA_ID=CAMNT_0008635867 /DNA_START=40 /DNA_END=2544 /DNA_ORIENTATION=+
MLSFLILSLFSTLALASQSDNIDAALEALNQRLSASNAKVNALRASTERAVLRQSQGHSSILGRSRGNKASCDDGSLVDTDKDGHLDCNDGCPTDFHKTRAGECGCGVRDIDSDRDGVADCNDECPLDAHKVQRGLCGCGAVDTGCGCNVEPRRRGDCSRVRATATSGTFDVFSASGTVAARLVLPADALTLREGEAIALSLVEPRADTNSDATRHSHALDIELLPPANADVREPDTQNGYALHSAATVCLASASAPAASGLCLGFFDAKTNGFKCFEQSVTYDAQLGLACAQATLLTRVQLVRSTRHTSLSPYIASVAPRQCPADGSCELRISGGNFDRGVLVSVRVGEQEVDVSTCEHDARQIVCSRVPSGLGKLMHVSVKFSQHAAADVSREATHENAFGYAAPQVHSVELHENRVRVKGVNFGPRGELPRDAVTVNGQPCAEPRVDEHDTSLTCLAPQRTVELVKRSLDKRSKRKHHHDDDDDDDEDDHVADEPVQVTLRLGGHDAVSSLPSHWQVPCKGSATQCADGTCAEQGEFCQRCPSGWARCGTTAPVQNGALCHTLRWLADNKPTDYDVTIDGADVQLPIGEHAKLWLSPAHPPMARKACLSIGTPAHAEGFASAVYNITSGATLAASTRLSIYSPQIAESGGDAYGYCLARWNCESTPKRWECIDENLCARTVNSGGWATGNVQLREGENLFALLVDNCPHVENPLQRDDDGNGVGDACDGAANVEESCRDLTQGNINYIQKMLTEATFDVEKQPCPYKTDKVVPVCNAQGQIFQKHAAESAGPARPLPLDTDVASEKGQRKSFPARQGIHAYPTQSRNINQN